MKTRIQSSRRPVEGHVLLTVTILLAISVLMAAGTYSYARSNQRLNQRNNDYIAATFAAEAATEKVLSQITTDFRAYGDGYLQQNLATYRAMVPSSSETGAWTNFDFEDLSGQSGDRQLDGDPHRLAGASPTMGVFARRQCGLHFRRSLLRHPLDLDRAALSGNDGPGPMKPC